MVEKLQVHNGIQIIIYNRSSIMGCYYPEDDWNISVVADNYNKAVERIIPLFKSSGIKPESCSILKVEYVIHKGTAHILTAKTSRIRKSLKELLKDITHHPKFKFFRSSI